MQRADTRSPRKPGLRKAKFEAVFQGGKRVSSKNFRVTAQPGEGRVGIATSKKIGCHARRNWVKRRIRESTFRLQAQLKPEFDYILIALPNVVAMSFEEIVAEMQDALERMNKRWAEESESS